MGLGHLICYTLNIRASKRNRLNAIEQRQSQLQMYKTRSQSYLPWGKEGEYWHTQDQEASNGCHLNSGRRRHKIWCNYPLLNNKSESLLGNQGLYFGSRRFPHLCGNLHRDPTWLSRNWSPYRKNYKGKNTIANMCQVTPGKESKNQRKHLG